MTNRTAERIEFLSGVLSAAMNHSGYGFPGIIEYKWDGIPEAETYAVIYDRYEENPTGPNWQPKQSWRVDIDTMAKGLGILRKKYGPKHNDTMRDVFEADRENDASQIDVVDALAILEAAVFGDITYS